MKLLQPKQQQQNKEKEDAIKRIRTAEVQREYEDKLKLLNILTVDFEKALEAQKDTYAKEKEAHLSWRQATEEEVKELEARRIASLLPIQEREEKIHTGEKEFIEGMALLEQKNDETENLRERLYKRLAEVGERETQASQIEKTLASRQAGVDAQAASVRSQASSLSKALEQFARDTSDTNAQLNKKRTEIDAISDGISMREARLEEKARELTEKEYRLGLYKLSLERNYKKSED